MTKKQPLPRINTKRLLREPRRTSDVLPAADLKMPHEVLITPITDASANGFEHSSHQPDTTFRPSEFSGDSLTADEGFSRVEIMRLPIKTIEPDPNNPRLYFDEDAIQRLATSIQEEGLLEPISVVRIAPERYRIRYGERRYRAHLHLGRETIDAMIWPADISSNTRQTQLVENLQRQDLDPFSETMAICEWIVGELGEDIISTRDGMLTASKSLARIIRKMRNEDAGRGTPVTPNVRRKIEGLFEITGRWQPASFLTARLNILYWPLLLQDACRQGIDPSKINLIRRITVHSINASPEKVEEVQREFIERAKTLSVKQLKREIDDVILSSTPDANNEKVGRTETELIDTAMQHLQLLQNRSLTPDQRFALESAVATLASLAG